MAHLDVPFSISSTEGQILISQSEAFNIVVKDRILGYILNCLMSILPDFTFDDTPDCRSRESAVKSS